MNKYRYILQPYEGRQTRFKCPNCNEKDSFVRYIDSVNGTHISTLVGKCNREIKCGYHFKPNDYFKNNQFEECDRIIPQTIKQQPISYINHDIFLQSLKCYEKNNFVQFLISKFGKEITNNLIEKYYLGTSKRWKGANIFWQLDITGKVRTGKIMLYNSETGKRIRKPFNHINWVHSVLKKSEFNLKQCFFGEHLLNSNSNNIMVVEAEKTAIIASAIMPQYTWLASGGLNSLDKERCTVLNKHNVIFHPDIGAYETWKTKINNFSEFKNFKVSKILEGNKGNCNLVNGDDLIDFFIKNAQF